MIPIALALLDDAWFDCLMARHDAIDGALMKIALDVEAAAKLLGATATVTAFPNFSRLLRLLEGANRKIRVSRRDRNNREAVYDTVSSVDFPMIADLFEDFRASEPVMKRIAIRERWIIAISIGFGVAGFAVGAISLAREFF